MTEKRNIKNVYISSDFLSDDLISKKSEEVNSLIDHTVKQNRSAFPVACFHFQSYNFSKNLGEKIPAIIIMFMVFVIPVLAIKRRNLLMYFSASALAGFEIILLLTLQIIIGNMYMLTGLIIAGLMTGLAVGAGTDNKLMRYFSLSLKSIFLLFFYIGFGLIYNYIILLKTGFPAVLLIVLAAFLPSVITGHIFRELTIKSDAITKTSAIYSADLAGSAFGFILLSGFAVPAFGIRVSIMLLSSLIFAGFLFGAISNKN
jgi:hypothetical protein